MQTFLPYADFAESAAVLDRKRLGKQRIECLQILRTNLGINKSWVNHPAVRMWRGYEAALVLYARAITQEWVKRGFRDTVLATIEQLAAQYHLSTTGAEMPPWLGDETIHESHQSNLVRKAPGHYRAFWPDIPDDLPYCWPGKRFYKNEEELRELRQAIAQTYGENSEATYENLAERFRVSPWVVRSAVLQYSQPRRPGGRVGRLKKADRDRRIIELYESLTMNQIAELFGLTKARVQQILAKNGVKTRATVPRTLAEQAHSRTLFEHLMEESKR